MPATTPATRHSARVISQTTSIARWVGMPQLRARVGLAAVARMAFPNRVYLSKPCMASIMMTATTMIAIWAVVSTSPLDRRSGPWSITYEDVKYPTIGSSTLAIISDAARDTITIPMRLVPLGWHAAYTNRFRRAQSTA